MQTGNILPTTTAVHEGATKAVSAYARQYIEPAFTRSEVEAMSDADAVRAYRRMVEAEDIARARATTAPHVMDACWRLEA